MTDPLFSMFLLLNTLILVEALLILFIWDLQNVLCCVEFDCFHFKLFTFQCILNFGEEEKSH